MDKKLRPSYKRIYSFFLIVNHHLIESKEYKYKPSTATTILDILRVCYIKYIDRKIFILNFIFRVNTVFILMFNK